MDAELPVAVPSVPLPSYGERLALRLIQTGAVVAVLAVTTLNVFELDRFFVPKELVLHLTALGAGLLLIRAIFRSVASRLDLLLAGYLGLSALSALMATNRWLAIRALAVSASGALLFLAARRLRDAGLARPLLNALALAAFLVAVTSLLQTYGLSTVFFSESRAPGGTLGNRNFVAHVAAFCLPLLLLAALRARETRAFGQRGVGIAMVVVTLVLTRSRAAWLAFAAVTLVFLAAMILSPWLRRDGRIWRRFTAIVVLSCGGLALALLLPNTLHWNSDNPYLQSIRTVADYQEGSGRGRLVQYEHSLLLAVRHPLFGVGPGNWAVVYPAHAARHDPSLDPADQGMTSNPWPSSDWMAYVSERGPVAAVMLAFLFFGLARSGWRQLRKSPDAGEALAGATLLGTVAAVVVAGSFDAVLLLPVPTLLVWTAFGALWEPEVSGVTVASPRSRGAVLALVMMVVAGGVYRSGAQLMAMEIFATRSDRASLVRAARIDPGNYRLQMRLARRGPRKERCVHGRSALRLFPNAGAAREVSCGGIE